MTEEAAIGGSVNQSNELASDLNARELTEKIWIDGTLAEAFVDTDAAVSVISPELSAKLKRRVQPWEGPTVVSADGKPLPINRFTVENHNARVTRDAIVINTFGPGFIMGPTSCRRLNNFRLVSAIPRSLNSGRYKLKA